MEENTSAPFDMWAKPASSTSQQYQTEVGQRMLRVELGEVGGTEA